MVWPVTVVVSFITKVVCDKSFCAMNYAKSCLKMFIYVSPSQAET